MMRLRGIRAREKTRASEEVREVRPRMTYGSRPERRPPLYLDSKVRAQRASCYDINCRLSSVTTYLCVHVAPSIAIADFATPLRLAIRTLPPSLPAPPHLSQRSIAARNPCGSARDSSRSRRK